MTDLETNVVHTGDAFNVLPTLPDASIHACVTDPPYGLAFMGRDWDDFEPREYQAWCTEWASEVKRVLKPGGHLLAFSGNRTHHRLFTGIEDAGFEIRDTLTWHYGSGFPKASDIGKTIDKRAGAEREKGEKYHNPDGTTRDYDGYDDSRDVYSPDEDGNDARRHSLPATEQAKKWDGWKTGLKPATEFVVMARKPFDGATVDCVLEYGTGALHIEACRIESDERPDREYTNKDEVDGIMWSDKSTVGGGSKATGTTTEGRYPANVIFGEREAERLDREVGDLGGGEQRTNDEVDSSSDGVHEGYQRPNVSMFTDDEPGGIRQFGDTGGPSRYFYTSKATKAERTLDGTLDNDHPTVKPQDLMEWLVKLVTKEGQTVLDPFAGSGTTCMAAKHLGREFVGIERQEQYADLARARIGLDVHNPAHVREDADQRGLGEYE